MTRESSNLYFFTTALWFWDPLRQWTRAFLLFCLQYHFFKGLCFGCLYGIPTVR